MTGNQDCQLPSPVTPCSTQQQPFQCFACLGFFYFSLCACIHARMCTRHVSAVSGYSTPIYMSMHECMHAMPASAVLPRRLLHRPLDRLTLTCYSLVLQGPITTFAPRRTYSWSVTHTAAIIYSLFFLQLKELFLLGIYLNHLVIHFEFLEIHSSQVLDAKPSFNLSNSVCSLLCV